MRISGGKARGVQLRVVQSAVHRPAMDKLRQSLFSSLGPYIVDAAVCDLFAGTGSYGLEALSRGAANALFVEKSKAAGEMIKGNLALVAKSMGAAKLGAEVHLADISKWQPGETNVYDLIFADPPYDDLLDLAPSTFAAAATLAKPGAILAFEMPGEIELSHPSWTLLKRLGKGTRQPTCCLYEKTAT